MKMPARGRSPPANYPRSRPNDVFHIVIVIWDLGGKEKERGEKGIWDLRED